ncbi:hypothetical protein [Streptomyces poonensis]|uniref:hypothetical protein n=1 Tax=Streptomyces poonensis TaxID=68255 RepID=UPI00167218BF|nr:hypothetical protein [Streptomyces poonensis]
MHDDVVAAHPNVGAGGPGRFDVVGHGPGDVHLAADGRESGTAEYGPHLLSQIRERFLVRVALGAYAYGGGEVTGGAVLGSHVVHSL